MLKEIKPNLERQEKEYKFVSVNYTNNEAQLYEKLLLCWSLIFLPSKKIKKVEEFFTCEKSAFNTTFMICQ